MSDISEEDGNQLFRDAIRAGMFNNLGSGSNVYLVVINPKDDMSDAFHKKDFDRLNIQVQYLRGFDEANVRREEAKVHFQ